MEIKLEPQVAIDLEAITVQTGRLEFSGLGTCRRDGDDLVIDDIELMNVGSEGYTEAPPQAIYDYMQKCQAAGKVPKVWFHRHPLGNGIPGDHNWSGRDTKTILEEPLGGFPHITKWSVSIVRTPGGWVGRLDNYVAGTTHHLSVVGQANPEVIKKAFELTDAYYKSLQEKGFSNRQYRFPEMGDYFDDGWVKYAEGLEAQSELEDVAYNVADVTFDHLWSKYGDKCARKFDRLALDENWAILMDGSPIIWPQEMPSQPRKEQIDALIKTDIWREYLQILYDDEMEALKEEENGQN